MEPLAAGRSPEQPPPQRKGARLSATIRARRARDRRNRWSRRFRPELVETLLLAEAPPSTLDRYFYFPVVTSQDSLFREVVRAVLNLEPTRSDKTERLRQLKDRGVYRADLDHAIRQIVSRAVVSDEVVDIFAAAGLKKPDISILSDEFLAEVRGMPRRNLAVELLQKLLRGEIRTRSRRNIVESRSFAALLDAALRKYQNRAIETAQVIEELIALARQMREADARGESLGLSEDELAFYDALETNDSAVAVLGDPVLREIARELADTVRRNVTIDWTVRDNVRAHLRVLVKRILRKHGYPPDKQEAATRTVLEQAEVLTESWAAV
jgi:type I site-specific restriction-modification system R (restriction) subunit